MFPHILFKLNIQSFEISLNASINAQPFKEKLSVEFSFKFTTQMSHSIRTTQKR